MVTCPNSLFYMTTSKKPQKNPKSQPVDTSSELLSTASEVFIHKEFFDVSGAMSCFSSNEQTSKESDFVHCWLEPVRDYQNK